jgi:hypothetical protein
MDLLGNLVKFVGNISPLSGIINIGSSLSGIDVRQVVSTANPLAGQVLQASELVSGAATIASGAAAGAALLAPAITVGPISALFARASSALPSVLPSISDIANSGVLNETPEDSAFADLTTDAENV